MQVKKDFDFKLSMPFSYDCSVNGKVEAKKLLMLAPSNKQLTSCVKLRQIILQAVKKATENRAPEPIEKNQKNKQDSGEIDAETILNLLGIANLLEDAFALFEIMIKNGICLVDGKVELNDFLFSKMYEEDTFRLLGEYLYHFLAASLKPSQK